MEQCNSVGAESPVKSFRQHLVILIKYPDLHLVFELKPHPTPSQAREAVAKGVQMVVEMGLADRTDYISFSLEACREFHRVAPAAKVFYLNGNLSPEELKREGFAGPDYNFAIFELHPSWIEESRSLGLETNVWTVNNDSLIRRFAKKGVDYITTNRPEEALEIVEN